jgi:large subunit ribosomal protein L28
MRVCDPDVRRSIFRPAPASVKAFSPPAPPVFPTKALDNTVFRGMILTFARYVTASEESIMANVCEICGKKTLFGTKYARRGAAKARGGSGQKISGKTNRRFRPNLQKVRAIVGGGVRRVTVCTTCIRSGKIKKAVRGMGAPKAGTAPAEPAAS